MSKQRRVKIDTPGGQPWPPAGQPWPNRSAGRTERMQRTLEARRAKRDAERKAAE